MTLIPAFEIGLWNAWIPMIYLLSTFPFFIRLAKDRAPDHQSDLADMSGGQKATCFSSKLIFIPALIYSVFLPFKLGTLWFYVGLPVALLGLVAYTAVLMNWAGTPPGKPVTSGLYRYSRNPMYVTAFLVFFGISIASASWVFLLFTISIIAGCVLFADLEEKGCLAQYGKIYSEYMDRTPKWIGMPKFEPPIWYLEKCIACGDCAEACNFRALQVVDGMPVIDQNKCKGCMRCVRVCTYDALAKRLAKTPTK